MARQVIVDDFAYAVGAEAGVQVEEGDDPCGAGFAPEDFAKGQVRPGRRPPAEES